MDGRRAAGNRYFRIVLQPGDLIAGQIEREIDIPSFQRDLLGGRLGDMAGR